VLTISGRQHSIGWSTLQVEVAVAELSITLRDFGIISWEYRCHAVVDCPFLNIIDKGVQLVVIVLEGGGVISAVPFQRFSNPSGPMIAIEPPRPATGDTQ
jgi:hypothetical protein